MAEKKTKAKKQDELVKKQGDALIASANLYMEDMIHTVKKSHDYIVTVAFGSPDGRYMPQSDGSLDWDMPEGFSNMHVEVVVQDRDDKRFVPYLDVSVRILDQNDNPVTESEAPFMWHPYVFHYGMDTVIPEEGDYTIEVTIKKPDFGRHHKDHGKRYADDVTIKLGPVKLSPPSGELDADE
jgi:hypothetical protein